MIESSCHDGIVGSSLINAAMAFLFTLCMSPWWDVFKALVCNCEVGNRFDVSDILSLWRQSDCRRRSATWKRSLCSLHRLETGIISNIVDVMSASLHSSTSRCFRDGSRWRESQSIALSSFVCNTRGSRFHSQCFGDSRQYVTFRQSIGVC